MKNALARSRAVLNKEAALGAAMALVFAVSSLLGRYFFDRESLDFEITFNLTFFSLLFMPILALAVGGKIGFGLFGASGLFAQSAVAQYFMLLASLVGATLLSPIFLVLTFVVLGLMHVINRIEKNAAVISSYIAFGSFSGIEGLFMALVFGAAVGVALDVIRKCWSGGTDFISPITTKEDIFSWGKINETTKEDIFSWGKINEIDYSDSIMDT